MPDASEYPFVIAPQSSDIYFAGIVVYKERESAYGMDLGNGLKTDE